MSPAIELHGVYRTYRHAGKSHHVLKNISLRIDAGEMLAIVGPSGAGKSSLMQLLGCLDQPSRGECLIHGQSVTTLPPAGLARLRQQHIGFIFQKYHLIPELDALANTALPAIYALYEHRARLARAAGLLTRLGLGAYQRHHPDQLSGGQQQRVGIARALMNGADIILADEPTGALDSVTGAEVMTILEDLHRQGYTVIIVTHDPQIAARAPRMITLRDGEIVADSGKQTVCARLQRPPAPRATWWRGTSARLREALAMAFHAIRARRLRTAVTLCGMVFGIAAVVTVTAAGTGARHQTLQQLRDLSPGVVQLLPGPGLFAEKTTDKLLTPDDAAALARLPGVDSVSPLVSWSGDVNFRQRSNKANLQGVGADYFRLHGLTLREGGVFRRDDSQAAVIDESTRQALFGATGQAAVGQILVAGDVPLRIVGVVRDSLYSIPGQVTVWVPWRTVMIRFTGQQPLQGIDLRLRDGTDNASSAVRAVRMLMTRRLGGRQNFTLLDNDSIRQKIVHTERIFNLLILIIAGVALGIGCLGVMNIMLVTVSERTREIGIRMAVGARREDIMWQFMAEALLISLTGGLLGLGLSVALEPVLTMMAGGYLTLLFSWQSAILAFFCALLTGLIFGWLPARRAARLDPVLALAGE